MYHQLDHNNDTNPLKSKKKLSEKCAKSLKLKVDTEEIITLRKTFNLNPNSEANWIYCGMWVPMVHEIFAKKIEKH